MLSCRIVPVIITILAEMITQASHDRKQVHNGIKRGKEGSERTIDIHGVETAELQRKRLFSQGSDELVRGRVVKYSDA